MESGGSTPGTFPPGHDVVLPYSPRNRKVRCKGKSVIRYKQDQDGHKKGEPILNDDFARQYRACESWGANDTEYCINHGGSAPQIINAAKRTLALAANEVAASLAQIAQDERVPAETRVRAAAQLLDRIGVRAGVDIGLEAPKWQDVLGKMFGSSAPADEAFDPQPERGAEVVDFVDVEETPAIERPKPRARKASPRKASAKAETRPKFEGW